MLLGIHVKKIVITRKIELIQAIDGTQEKGEIREIGTSTRRYS